MTAYLTPAGTSVFVAAPAYVPVILELDSEGVLGVSELNQKILENPSPELAVSVLLQAAEANGWTVKPGKTPDPVFKGAYAR
jgi:hypothetical protein